MDKWGIDIERLIARKHEDDFLVYIPKNSNVLFRDLHSLRG